MNSTDSCCKVVIDTRFKNTVKYPITLRRIIIKKSKVGVYQVLNVEKREFYISLEAVVRMLSKRLNEFPHDLACPL